MSKHQIDEITHKIKFMNNYPFKRLVTGERLKELSFIEQLLHPNSRLKHLTLISHTASNKIKLLDKFSNHSHLKLTYK